MRPGRKGVEMKAAKPVELPRASFKQIEDEESTKPLGVHDLQARSYGYNNFDDWERPEYYIRYIEPIESELAVQVEYDMDEQDQEWLDALNKERKDQGLDQVTYETFEIVMDKLEKEWFDLMKRVPKSQTDAPPEDSTCAVCDDGEGENSNAIVFCDGCNLAVHQECYGIPYIPEGQWLCRKCTISPQTPVSCQLCPAEAGAFKQTNTGKWVHLLCALWNPEVTVTKGAYMEPIEGIERISRARWRLGCSICKIKKGACIQCQKSSCTTAFHVTCARQQGLLGSMKSFAEEEHSLRVFCEHHLPPDMLKNRRIHTPPPASSSGTTLKSTKAALAHSSHYAPPAPVIPMYVYERVMQYTSKIRVLKKKDWLALVCKYWSLKREARRGAPLLKRLHLEPWTASSSNRHKTEEQKARQLKFLGNLRADIERIRIMAEYVIRRERKKMDRVEALQNTIGAILFPFENALDDALDQIVAVDKLKHFLDPVDRADVPDYYDVVKNPMDWTQMKEKIKQHEYLNVEDFQNDVNLVFDNAMLYNALGTPHYKSAQKCKESCAPILTDLNGLKRDNAVANGVGLPAANGSEAPAVNGSVEGEINGVPLPQANGISPTISANTSDSDATRIPPDLRHVNNLEPSLAILDLLNHPDTLDAQDLDFMLAGSPLDFFYFYGLTELKPPPTPPPPPAKVPRQRDRAAERARKQEQRERDAAEREELLRQAFITPRTRGGRKVAESGQSASGGAQSSAQGTIIPPEGETPASTVDNKTTAVDLPEGAGPTPIEDEKPRRRRGGAANLPGVPLMLSDTHQMTAHGQFTHFEAGWVLGSRTRSGSNPRFSTTPAPGPSRKRGREAAEVTSGPRPRKRQRQKAPVSSDISALPTSEAMPVEQATPDLFEGDVSDVTESDGEGDVDMDQPESSKKPQAAPLPEPKVEPEAPIPRRTRRSAPPTDPEEPSAASSGEAGPSKMKGKGRPKPIVDGMYGKRGAKPAAVKDNPISDEKAAQVFQNGSIVWAKCNKDPWFPGEIFALNDEEMRDDIANARSKAESQFEGRELRFVRFFDKKKTSAWLPASKLHLLGQSKERDAALLNGKTFRTAHQKQSVRHAYEEARQQLGNPEWSSGEVEVAVQTSSEREPDSMDVDE